MDLVESGYRDVAQVCLKGHVANATYNNCPEERDEFCVDCGEPTITACKNGHSIPGAYIDENGEADDPFGYVPPSYCRECGDAFPWTKSRLEKAAARVGEIATESGFSETDVAGMKSTVLSIGSPDPETSTTNAGKLMSYVQRMAPPIGQKVLDIVGKIASEVASAFIRSHMG